MARANTIKSKAKPEFADYTIAGTPEGQINAMALRGAYKAERDEIKARRMNRLDNRFWDTRIKPHLVKIRANLPKRRKINDDIPSHRGVPHSNFLKRFKFTYNRAEDICKIYVLHATRGWKLYA